MFGIENNATVQELLVLLIVSQWLVAFVFVRPFDNMKKDVGSIRSSLHRLEMKDLGE